MKSSISLVVAVLAATAGCATDHKQDVSQPAFDATEDTKDDNPHAPTHGAAIRIGELVHGKFTATHGFLSHEIQLDAGRVDIDLTGTEAGQPLDTILYVFGPRRASGRYAQAAVAFNDDFEPGVNLGSHIVLDVPAAGTYRIVASTYDNAINFPVHVSVADYQLIVKCESEAFGACGPQVSGQDGACWADTDCLASDGTTMACDGEITCAPGTECLFVRMGTCQPRAKVGDACGGRGLSPCGDGLFCLFGDGADCGRSDHPGTCAVIPQACTQLYSPVCGCDGQTYSNACFAAGAGVSPETHGACL